jgi:hypothetical protein
LGGTIVVSLGSTANVSATGILLVSADDRLSGTTPTLLLLLPNGTILTILDDENSCRQGYYLQRREKSLFLIFDTGTGVCSTPLDAPLSSNLPELSSSNAGAIVGGVVGGVILLTIIVAIVLVSVPSLRKRVQPFLQRTRKQANNVRTLDSTSVQMGYAEPSPSNPAWVRTRATGFN